MILSCKFKIEKTSAEYKKIYICINLAYIDDYINYNYM